MEITTIAGLLIGLVCIIVSIPIGGGELSGFIDGGSIFIVFGGVIAATIASYPMSVLKNLIKIMSTAFKANNVDLSKEVDNIIDLANVARREGILALEERVAATDDPFLKKGIMLVVDGSDPELVRTIMETELDFISERHQMGQAVLLQMSSYSPAFGMIGTLIGLINMLAKLDDPSALGPGMATALVTTFYGSFLANMIFTPLAKKLGVMSSEEYLRKEMALEGLLSIQDGENPRIIREKLNAFLSQSQLKEYELKHGGEAKEEEAAQSESSE